MRKVYASLILVAAIVSACSLSSADTADEGESVSQLPTATIQPTTEAVTLATQAVDDEGIQPVNTGSSTTCTLRTDWQVVYSVVAGDTLGSIARRSASTVNALATGNCLSNPNQLEVGQTLRLPQVPTGVLPDVAPTVNDRDPRYDIYQCPYSNLSNFDIGSNIVAITPVQGFNNGCYTLKAGQTVTLRWDSAPVGTTEVQFYTRIIDSMGRNVIGVDNNPADGFSVQVTVDPNWGSAAISAWGVNATLPGGVVESDPIGFWVNAGTGCDLEGPGTISANAVTVSPNAGTDGGCYVVRANETVTVRWNNAPAGLTRVEFYRRSPFMTRSDVIGVDENPADGFSVEWVAYANMPASYLFAFGYGSTQGSQQDSDMVGVYVQN
jgi:LysM repeat protein